MRHFFPKFPLFLMVFLFAFQLKAQDVASLTGVVTDPSGAVIPNVSVSLVNTTTNATYQAQTNGIGSYSFASVPPGPGYKVTFARDGFKPQVISDIYLTVGATRTLNTHLSLGAASQTVEVSAGNATVTLDTTDASIGNNIDVQRLNELPVYDRTTGIATLFKQQPGVDSFQGAVTGARIDQTEVTVDGLDVDDLASGQTFAIVATAPVDSVEQFNGTVAGLSSAVGTGSGAQFQLVTKSGSNKFHGNVNEYHRDTTTEANTWFNNLTGLPRTPLIRNQFGGNIGGPIKRNKLFFFFDIADSRIVQSATEERNVPLSQFRNGTLNYINSGPGCGDNTRITNLTTLPSCITTAPASEIQSLDPGGIGVNAPQLAFINARYPEPNDPSGGDGVNTAGYRFTYPDPDNQITYVGRVDYSLTPTQKIYGRFTINREDAIESAPEFKTDPVTHPFYDRSYSYVVSHVWNIGSNKVNQFYYGDTISKLRFPDLYNPSGANQFSYQAAGNPWIDGPYTDFDGQARRVPVPIVRDDFNWQRGAHSLTMGGTFKFIKTNSNLISNFNFPELGLQGSALSGGLDAAVRPSDILVDPNNPVALNDYDNLFADDLGVIGEISTNYTYNNKGAANPAGSGGPRAYRFFETEMYVGDTWKVNKKLTLSYGLRYQLYSVPYEAHGDESVPTTSPNNAINLDTFIGDRLAYDKTGNPTNSNSGLPFYSYVLGGKANHGPDLYGMSYKDFAPRVAFAYTPWNSQKTVINGGAGIVYDRTVINAINFLQDQISYLFFNSPTNQNGSSDGADASLAVDPRVSSAPATGQTAAPGQPSTVLAYSNSLNPAPEPITTPYLPYVDNTGTPYGLANGQTNFVISPNLKDPYSIALNFGVQQEIPGHMIVKANYVGRLGRRLLADADANQVIDVPDYTGGSTQTMAGAFAGLTTELRSGAAITPQPWFENVLLPGFGAASGLPGVTNNTQLVAYFAGQLAQRGDIADSIQSLAYYTFGSGFLPTNIGIPSQFGTNAYLTNLGSSNYHGLLLTLDKNISQGLQFEFNYTWSHSIDNTSLSTNDNALFSNTGFICDILQPRACRGNSDFDVRQEITSNFTYDLPFGHDREFLATSPAWMNQVIGGWNLSGLITRRTGLPFNAYSDAYLASFDNADPAIFTGNKSDLKAKVNVDPSTDIVYDFAGGAAGAAKVLSEFRGPVGIEYGQRNLIRGPGAFFFDAGFGKTFPLVEDLRLVFRADAFNLFNHPNFAPPGGTNSEGLQGENIVTNASAFGQIFATSKAPDSISAPEDNQRVAQFSLRLEF